MIRRAVALLLAVMGLPVAGLCAPQSASVGFTDEQAAGGRDVYAEKCAGCHGEDLAGTSGPALKGPRFDLDWLNGRKAAGDLYRTLRQTMPLTAAGSLSDKEYVNLTAYLLLRNGYAAGNKPYDNDVMGAVVLQPRKATSTTAAKKSRPRLPQPPKSVVAASTTRPDDDEIATPDDANWLLYNKTLDGQRYSSLAQITSANAASLAPRCLFQLGETGSFQASPIIYERMLYVTTAYNTYAIDATDCTAAWAHRYPVNKNPPVLVTRGVAIYRGKVYRVTPDGHLLALDAKNGRLLWDVWMSDNERGYWLTAAPVAFDGKVFVGEAGADYGVVAHIYAFDAETGARVWTFDTIPTGTQTGAETWKAGAEHGGGSLWTTLTLDPQRQQLYASIGNPAPDFDGTVRPGNNLFTNSVVVLDTRTGALQWYVQQVPHDTHDSDTAAAPVIYSQGGRRYMAVANKAGWLYIYDAETHRLLTKTEVAPHENSAAPITKEGTHVCPGINGGVEWYGPAYSSQSKLLYVNSVHWCSTVRLIRSQYVEGSAYFEGDFVYDPVSQAKGSTYAIDAATGKLLWSRASSTPMVAALTPTAGNVVFTGDLNGYFLALDAGNGDGLYRFNTGGAIAGGISTYSIDGRQYVAVASGNSSRSIWFTTGSATIILFALAGP
jgi:alcohol dehydrogenase (cytochrome c)